MPGISVVRTPRRSRPKGEGLRAKGWSREQGTGIRD
jgi:hypothetical protein